MQPKTAIPLLGRFLNRESLVDEAAGPWLENCLQQLARGEHAQDTVADFGAHLGDPDFWPDPASWKAQYRPYVVRAGVLHIPVLGVLLNNFGWQMGEFATGYTYIQRAYERGMEDANVRGIAFVVDSRGGEAAGLFDLSDLIRTRRTEKPVRAFVQGVALSGAYGITSAAGAVSITRSGTTGSVGVVMNHVDWSKAVEAAGLNITFVYAGKHKIDGHPYAPLDAKVKADWQARVDSIYGVFTSTVARNRVMEDAEVRATEARIYDAESSVEVGFADRIGPFDSEMIQFATDVAQREEESMTTASSKTAALGAKGAADQEAAEKVAAAEVKTAADQEAAEKAAAAEAKTAADQETAEKAAAVAAEKSDVEKAAATEGAQRERERIQGILGCSEALSRPMAARQCALKTSLSVVDARAFLAGMPEEKHAAGAFAAAMEATGNPDVGDGGDGDGGEDLTEAQRNSASLLASYRVATGSKVGASSNGSAR